MALLLIVVAIISIVFSAISFMTHSAVPWVRDAVAPIAWLEGPLLFSMVALLVFQFSGKWKLSLILGVIVVLLWGIFGVGWFL